MPQGFRRTLFLALSLVVALATSAKANCFQDIHVSTACKISWAVREEVTAREPNDTSEEVWQAMVRNDPQLQKNIACNEHASDNITMSGCAWASVQGYQRELDLVYQAALNSVDKNTQARLRQSQADWLRFFDSENGARNHLEDVVGGSGAGILSMYEEVEIVKQRIAQLSFYLG